MNVILSESARKQYDSLSKVNQKKIYKKLYSLSNNPYSGKKLAGELIGIRSIRAWPYRILYEVNEKTKTIEIYKIAHRQGAYK